MKIERPQLSESQSVPSARLVPGRVYCNALNHPHDPTTGLWLRDHNDRMVSLSGGWVKEVHWFGFSEWREVKGKFVLDLSQE